MNNAKHYDVIILGMGPVGATLANLLGQKGHSVAVLEMRSNIYDKPRAINLDQEALRLWQRVGVADDIADGAALHPGTDFLGADGKLIKAIYSAPPPYPMGWPANVMFVQPEAEQRLRERISQFSNVDVFLEYTAINISQTPEDVSVTCDSPEGQHSLHGRYLIGSDGANSPTRASMQVKQSDLGFSEHYVVVDAWLTKDTPLPPRTTQYCWPVAPTSYVVCSGNLRRWELKILAEENVDDYESLEKIKSRLAPFVDVDALKFWRSAVYHFNARVADCWCDKRILLAGDAAHTMPPFLGQGLNSGLRDAANIAWKLSYVLNNKASEHLLDSYQRERRPHILALTEITKELGQIVGETDPEKAALRDKRLRAEMKIGGAVTVRQSLIPPLVEGFLDIEGGQLAGQMSPQPTVIQHNRTEKNPTLLDELLSGFSLLEYDSKHNKLKITNDVETDHPAALICTLADDPLSEVLLECSATFIIIRPDGIIWSAANSGLSDTVNRLKTNLNIRTTENTA